MTDPIRVVKLVPIPGDYGCVSIWWITRTVLGKEVRLPNILGLLICLQTWSKFCHAFVYIGDGKIVEAQPSGACVSPLAKYDNKNIVWSTDALDTSQRQIIIAKARSQIGK